MCCGDSFCGCHGRHGQWILSALAVQNVHYSKEIELHWMINYWVFCINSSKGLYTKTLRTVVDMRDCYYLATEELGCKECGGRYQCWDQRWVLQWQLTVINVGLCCSILNQLTESRLGLFPAILTRKYACDVAVVSLLRGRTLGNSPTALRNAIMEVHSEEWMRKQLRYLDDWQRYRWVYGL